MRTLKETPFWIVSQGSPRDAQNNRGYFYCPDLSPRRHVNPIVKDIMHFGHRAWRIWAGLNLKASCLGTSFHNTKTMSCKLLREGRNHYFFLGMTSMNHRNDQHDMISLRVQQWKTSLVGNHSCLIVPKATQQESNDARHWKFSQLPGASKVNNPYNHYTKRQNFYTYTHS